MRRRKKKKPKQFLRTLALRQSSGTVSSPPSSSVEVELDVDDPDEAEPIDAPPAPSAPSPPPSWPSLRLHPLLLSTISTLSFPHPTPIQSRFIPRALSDPPKDLICVAPTGTGKTAAFILPVLHRMISRGSRVGLGECIVIVPTRELAVQLKNHVEALGAGVGVKCSCVIGQGAGVPGSSTPSIRDQISQLERDRPHVVVGTPGRLHELLRRTSRPGSFGMYGCRWLIIDEADTMLGVAYRRDLDGILRFAKVATEARLSTRLLDEENENEDEDDEDETQPQRRRRRRRRKNLREDVERTTFIATATMTKKVWKLQKLHLRPNAEKIDCGTRYGTVESLLQQYLFIPEKFKEVYLCYVLNELAGKRILVFVGQNRDCLLLTILLRSVGFPSVPLTGVMSESDRLKCLRKFSAGDYPILVATDVAARGLDIADVSVVINYDIPLHSKKYIHRVGRTARIGRSGTALTFVTQYDIEYFQRLERLLKVKMTAFPVVKEDALVLCSTVLKALKMARGRVRLNEKGVEEDDQVIDDAVANLRKKDLRGSRRGSSRRSRGRGRGRGGGRSRKRPRSASAQADSMNKRPRKRRKFS